MARPFLVCRPAPMWLLCSHDAANVVAETPNFLATDLRNCIVHDQCILTFVWCVWSGWSLQWCSKIKGHSTWFHLLIGTKSKNTYRNYHSYRERQLYVRMWMYKTPDTLTNHDTEMKGLPNSWYIRNVHTYTCAYSALYIYMYLWLSTVLTHISMYIRMCCHTEFGPKSVMTCNQMNAVHLFLVLVDCSPFAFPYCWSWRLESD